MTSAPYAQLALTPPGRLATSGPAGKHDLRTRLAAHGVPVPRSWTADEPERIRPALVRSGYPAVVKPDGLGGGRGVYLVTSAQQVPGWLAMLGQYQYRGPVLAEEYVGGPQLTVLTSSDSGRHSVTAVIATELSLPPLFVEMGHVYSTAVPAETATAGAQGGPAANGSPAFASPDVHRPASGAGPQARAREAAGAVALAALDACGHATGPAQVSVRIADSGPVVMGLHRGASADPVVRLPRHAAAAAGQPGTTTAAAVSSTAATSHFWLPAGDVEAVGALDPIRALPWVAELAFGFGPGDRLPQITDARTRHGHVTVTAAHPAEAAERIATVKTMLAVTVRPRLPLGAVPRPRSPRRSVTVAPHSDRAP
ncbi:MAG: bacD1 [Actinomycetia bacterium]|nr:bacD1 [Actinomycetes bacterium]